MTTFKTFSITLRRDLEGKKIPNMQNKVLGELMKNIYKFCETAKNRLIMFVNAFSTFQKDWKQQLFLLLTMIFQDQSRHVRHAFLCFN